MANKKTQISNKKPQIPTRNHRCSTTNSVGALAGIVGVLAGIVVILVGHRVVSPSGFVAQTPLLRKHSRRPPKLQLNGLHSRLPMRAGPGHG